MPASTTVIADLKTANTTGPNATSLANALDPTKKIMDLKGNIDLAVLKAIELKTLLTELNTAVDAGDPIKTQIANVLLTLV